MDSKGVYFTFLAIFVLRAAFAALPYDSPPVGWYILSDQETTFQFAFWRMNLLLVELFLLMVITAVTMQGEADRLRTLRMARAMVAIQGWYILEYCTHYTSVWITWEQLGLQGDGRSGLSSHIATMLAFSYFGRWSMS